MAGIGDPGYSISETALALEGAASSAPFARPAQPRGIAAHASNFLFVAPLTRAAISSTDDSPFCRRLRPTRFSLPISPPPLLMLPMPARSPTTLRTVLVALALALGTMLLFSRSAGYGFLKYDDQRYLLDNVHVQNGFSADALRWVFTGHADIWAPVVRLTQILDWNLFGDAATGHHVHNILWHALSAALVFLLLRRLTGAYWTSALCAAVFAWHPLRVESVSWISERKDVVSVAFGLLTLLAYTGYARRRAERTPTAWRFYALTLATFTAALLSKPSMVALPGVLLLLDFWPLHRFAFSRATGSPAFDSTAFPAAPAPERTASVFLEKLPFVLLAAAASLVVIRTQAADGDFVLDLPLGARLANAVVSIPRYLGRFFWPFDLAVAYPHPGVWPLWAVAAAAAFVLAVSTLAWRTRRSMPWLAVGWLWFLGTLAPMIGILQVGFQSIADRYTYFPLLGWQIALLWTLREFAPRFAPRWALATASALVLSALAARTWDQQRHWCNDTALFTHACSVTENNATALAFLAYTDTSFARFKEARTHALAARAIDPKNHTAVYTLALLDMADNRTEEAIAGFRVALALKPDDADSACALANLLCTRNEPGEAERLYRAIVERRPHYSAAYIGLSKLEYSRGNRDRAATILADALTANPDDIPLLAQYGSLLRSLGRAPEADELFENALRRSPRSAPLFQAHSAYLAAAGQTEEALSPLDRAIALEPAVAPLHADRGQLLERLGRDEEALAEYAIVLAQDSTAAGVAFHAGELELKRGNSAKAAELYRQAIAAQPNLAPAHFALAQLAEKAGNTAEADAGFARALAAAPDDAMIERLCAETLARRRQFAAALPHYRRATELAPSDAAAHAGYGYMLFLTGRRSEALAAWDETLRLKPDFPGLRERVERLRASKP
jgi:tetratricopeptide (TPR) repeat protein